MGDQIDDSSKSRDANPQRHMPAGNSSTLSPDNLVNGEQVHEPGRETLPSHSTPYSRTPDGAYRKPVPPQRSVSDVHNGPNSSQLPVVESGITAASPQVCIWVVICV